MDFTHFEGNDDLELIKLVEANRCLYDKKVREFKIVDKKEVWAQIGAALTKKRTGDNAQKRWDSLRTMWSRQHKKNYEQGRSGSGARQDTQEFQYYGEMSFLISHYSSRQTKSNMKRRASCISNNESSEFQFVINKPSTSKSTVMETDLGIVQYMKRPASCTFNNESSEFQIASTSQSTVMETDLGTVEWNSDLCESVSLCSDDSFLQPSPQQQINEIHKSDTDTGDSVPFSPTAQAILQKFSSKQLPANKICTKQKYKQKDISNIKVPEPDEFCKKKRVDLDSYMHSSAKSLEKVAQSVGDILSQKAVGNKENVSHSIDKNIDPNDKDVSDMLKCVHIGLKQVKSDKRFECVLEMLKVINVYKEQG